MLPSRALEYARELLAAGWCQEAEARDQDGDPVDPWDPSATAWSLLGALVAVAAEAQQEATVLDEVGTTVLALVTGTPSVALRAWNDDPRRRHHEVLRAYDKAIELLPPVAKAHQVEGSRERNPWPRA